DGDVRIGTITPGDPLSHTGAARRSLVTPPGTRLEYRVHAPTNAVLRFAVAVEGTGRRDTSRAGIRFTLTVDGVERFSRRVNPAAVRGDRTWFDADTPLSADDATRDVVITMATDRVGGGELAGTPGWSNVRVVERRFRDRQPADATRPNVLLLVVDTLRAD